MFVAMNRFAVAEGRGDDFEAAWKGRDSYLSEVPGFVEFKLLKGEGDVYISHSTWENEAAFMRWTESGQFAAAHRQRLPEGVLAGPPEFSGYQVLLELEKAA